MTAIFGVLISLAALIIACYGIWERRLAAYATLRGKIIDLLSSLEDLNVQEGHYYDERKSQGEDPYITPGWTAYGFTGRRALLVYQVLDLMSELPKKVTRKWTRTPTLTVSEYTAIAFGLHQLGDFSAASATWRAAVANTKPTTAVARAAAMRGYATTLFQIGELDQGRAYYQGALDVLRLESDPDPWAIFGTYVQWFEQERGLGYDQQAETVATALREFINTVPHQLADEMRNIVLSRSRAGAMQTRSTSSGS